MLAPKTGCTPFWGHWFYTGIRGSLLQAHLPQLARLGSDGTVLLCRWRGGRRVPALLPRVRWLRSLHPALDRDAVGAGSGRRAAGSAQVRSSAACLRVRLAGTLQAFGLAAGFRAAPSISALQAWPLKQRGQEGGGRGRCPHGLPPLLPLAAFLPSGCVYAVVSLPLSWVSFRCGLISQESPVLLPQSVPSSSFYLAALFSGCIRSAVLDAFCKRNELGPAQPSAAWETQHLSSRPAPAAPGKGGWVPTSVSLSSVIFCSLLGDEVCGAVPKSSPVVGVMVQAPVRFVRWESSCLLCFGRVLLTM